MPFGTYAAPTLARAALDSRAPTKGRRIMGHKIGIASTVFAFAAASASSASAQTLMQESTQQSTTMESERLPRGVVRAPSNAFEIQVNTGYAQGFGPRIPARGETPATSLDRSGMSAGLGLAYRATPNSSVGIVGSYTMQDTAKGAQLRGATASLDATYHANPYQRLDPFLSIGTGYRMLWDRPMANNDNNGANTFTHGFQLARAAVGLDIRVTKSIAIAPTLGGDVNMFLWRSASGQGTETIENPKVNAYLFAGVAGRFDLGGNRVAPPTYMGGR
jgi:outer membrane protein W